jgi:hypothetical protein
MMQQNTLVGFVGRISRPKMTGAGTHAGVLLPSGAVAHLTPDGASIVSFAEFAQGRPVRAEKAADRSMHHQIEWRARLTLGRTRPYDLLNRNCEHYAGFVMGQKPDSPQVIAALLLSVLGVVFLAAQ